MKGDVEDMLDLEHKASRMNEWYPQRGPRKMGRLSAIIKSPERWTAETPYLYKLHLTLQNGEGKSRRTDRTGRRFPLCRNQKKDNC